jgi:hypothetical protein
MKTDQWQNNNNQIFLEKRDGKWEMSTEQKGKTCDWRYYAFP